MSTTAKASWRAFDGLSLRVSDSAVKQILLTMNEKDPFIIEDLDEYHLVIKADDEYRVRRELDAEVRSGILMMHS